MGNRSIGAFLLGFGVSLLATAGATADGQRDSRSTRAEVSRQLRTKITVAAQARDTGDPEQAARIYREVIHEASAFAPKSLPLAQALDGLAEVQRELGRYSAAEDSYVRAIALWEDLLGAGQPRTALALHNLAGVQRSLERADDARVTLERALQVWKASARRDSEDAAATAAALERLTEGHSTETPSR